MMRIDGKPIMTYRPRIVRIAFAIAAAVLAVLWLGPAALRASEQGADVAIVDSGYTRHYASLNGWDYRSEFVDINWLISTLARALSASVSATTPSTSKIMAHIDEPSPGKVPGDTPGGLSARTKTSGGPVMRTAARSVEMAAGQGLEP